MKSVVSLLLCYLVVACESTKTTQSNPDHTVIKDAINGIVDTYDKAGNLQSQITYENGLKHGKSLLYHDGSDQVMLEMYYQQGERNGEAIKYYENGEIYAVTPYEDDEVNGIVRLYFRNGKIKAEIPYSQSRSGLGLREYYTNGELKTDMPEIISRKQKIGSQNVYYFSIENCTKPNFYIGGLLDNKYLLEKPPFVEVLPLRNGEGIYGYHESKAGETINIICKCMTRARNPYVTRKVLVL